MRSVAPNEGKEREWDEREIFVKQRRAEEGVEEDDEDCDSQRQQFRFRVQGRDACS